MPLTPSAPPSDQRDRGFDLLIRFLDVVYVLCFNYFRMVGLFWRRFLRGSRVVWTRFYRRFLHRYFHQLDLLWLRLRKIFSRAYRYLFYRLYLFLRFFVDAFHVLRDGFCRYPERNILIRLGCMCLAFFRGVRNNAHLFVTLINYSLPVVAAVLFFNLVTYMFRLNFVVDVTLGDLHLGYIKDETVYNAAETSLQNRILYQQGEEALIQTPTFAVTIAAPSEMTSADQLTDTLMQLSTDDLTYGMGIWIENEFLGVVEDGSAIEETLQNQLQAAYSGDPSESVSFNKAIVLSRGYYLQNNLRDESQIVALLNQNVEEDVYDTVQSGDAPSLIAQRNNMSLDELVALNPTILETCVVGQAVKVHSSKPFLPIKVTRTETYTEEIPYATNKYNTDLYWEGQTVTTSDGIPGSRRVTADISYVNGVEVSRTILTTEVLVDPVTEQVAVGTRPMPKVESIAGASTSDYGLIWPVQSSFYISQHYGEYGPSLDGSPHRGTDFAGIGYGAPIVSVLPGTVTFAGWNGSYGYQVQVNHGNGMVTTYSHNSRLNVSYGDTIAQGQVIAYAGATGFAFGVHLHFELYVYGVRKNPELYLP